MPPPHSYVPLMASSAAPLSADDLLRARIPDKRTELVQGRLIVREPAGSLHGLVAMSLGAEVVAHVKRTGAGGVFAAETGFKLASNPDTVRAPDVAFIAKDRLPSRDTRGYPALAPDLVVEVLSPDDRAGDRRARRRGRASRLQLRARDHPLKRQQQVPSLRSGRALRFARVPPEK